MTELPPPSGHAPGDGRELQVVVVHASPGRLRIKLDRPVWETPEHRLAARALSHGEGVREVRSNAWATSVTVSYDPDRTGLPELLGAVAASGVAIVARVEGPVREAAVPGQSLVDFLREVDRRVASWTGGRTDLRTLVPVGLAALAAREVVAGRVGTAPWYVFAWYAFDSFLKLRRPAADPGGGRGG